MDAFLKKIFFVEGSFLGRSVTFSCRKIHFDFFRNLRDVFDRFFQNRVIRLQSNNLKKPNFPEKFFPLNFSRFSRRSLKFGHLAKRFETCGGKSSINFDKTALQMSERKIACVPSCFPNMNEPRPNVDEFGKQWVRRPIFCVDDFLCFIQNGGNEGDRCQATPTYEKMLLRNKNAICFWKNPFCVSFLVLFKNYKVFF